MVGNRPIETDIARRMSYHGMNDTIPDVLMHEQHRTLLINLLGPVGSARGLHQTPEDQHRPTLSVGGT